MVKKEAGGPWDCYQAYNFFGWEAERVVAYLIIVTGTMGGARVKIFCQV